MPEVAELRKLDTVLADWPTGRQLIFCDEAAVGAKHTLQAANRATSWAILIGPEGGFSPAERDRLTGLPHVTRISLGPRILRTDTAAVAAMTLWQAKLGDW